MRTLRRRMYHVQENTWTAGEYDVLRQIEGSQNFETVETYGSEIMAARVAMHLQSFANADYQMRFDALAKKANS